MRGSRIEPRCENTGNCGFPPIIYLFKYSSNSLKDIRNSSLSFCYCQRTKWHSWTCHRSYVKGIYVPWVLYGIISQKQSVQNNKKCSTTEGENNSIIPTSISKPQIYVHPSISSSASIMIYAYY